MTARLDKSHREDKTGLDVQMSQLTDAAGNTALVSDIVAGNLAGGTAAALTLSSTLDVAGATTLSSTLEVTGLTTLAVMPVLPRSTVAATGTDLATAAQLTAGVVKVTAADGTKGVKLPATPAAGTFIIIKNVDVANAVLKVWPDASATINAIGSNGAISMAAKTSALLWADSTTQWYTLPLLPS